MTSSSISVRESDQIAAANASGKRPVVFVHGLWLLAESWNPWRDFFDAKGFATVAVDWPGDQPTTSLAHAHPESLDGTSIADVADHVAAVVAQLDVEPVLIGHSFGGLVVQMVAGRGVAAATVSIDPAPSQGVLPLPVSTIKSALPVLGNPFTFGRTVTLTFDQFRYGFANAVDETQARELYDAQHTPGPGRPLFQAATANFNPWAKTKVDKRNPERGPMLLITGEKDHIAPGVMTRAAFAKQRTNPSATELVEIPGAGHSLVIDDNWELVAQRSADFLARQGIS